MLKVFATQVVVSRGYDGAAAIKFSEKGDAVRFRIGKKVYDPNAENNARWINLAVKGFGPICERIKKMQLKEGDHVIFSRYGGTDLKHEGVEYTIMEQKDSLAVIE